MHKVTLRKGFTGSQRHRAGIRVTATEPYEGELTKDQQDAIKADTELVLSEVKASGSKAAGTTRNMVEKPQAAKKN